MKLAYTGADIESIMLSELIQRERDRYKMTTLICGVPKENNSRGPETYKGACLGLGTLGFNLQSPVLSPLGVKTKRNNKTTIGQHTCFYTCSHTVNIQSSKKKNTWKAFPLGALFLKAGEMQILGFPYHLQRGKGKLVIRINWKSMSKLQLFPLYSQYEHMLVCLYTWQSNELIIVRQGKGSTFKNIHHKYFIVGLQIVQWVVESLPHTAEQSSVPQHHIWSAKYYQQ